MKYNKEQTEYNNDNINEEIGQRAVVLPSLLDRASYRLVGGAIFAEPLVSCGGGSPVADEKTPSLVRSVRL